LNLQSIAINGQLLPIDQEVFATSNNHGTIVDSGTTLAYLVEEAYGPFVSGVSSSTTLGIGIRFFLLFPRSFHFHL